MPTYRTSAKRINFGFTPALIQSADVVFSTNIPFENETIEEFEAVAWKEILKQNPHWKKAEGPVKGKSGWSSVIPSGKYEKIA